MQISNFLKVCQAFFIFLPSFLNSSNSKTLSFYSPSLQSLSPTLPLLFLTHWDQPLGALGSLLNHSFYLLILVNSCPNLFLQLVELKKRLIHLKHQLSFLSYYDDFYPKKDILIRQTKLQGFSISFEKLLLLVSFVPPFLLPSFPLTFSL